MPHLYAPNEWVDYFRILIFLFSAYSGIALLLRYRQEGGRNWNVKTKDYWYAALMWSIAACELSLQGIALNRPFTPATVLITAAVIVTFKAVHRKGPWGSDAE